MKIIFICLISLFLNGCINTPLAKVPVYKLDKNFDSEQAKLQLEKGNNTIKGSALIKQRGGGIITCAGNIIYLVPKTNYAQERMFYIYGNDENGFNKSSYSFIPDESEYYKLTKSTICDTQGYFKFEKIKDGEYYIITTIQWLVGYNQQGGSLMKKVSVSNEEIKDIVLVP